MSDKEQRAYEKALKAWKAREPKDADQTTYEAWLEEKPQKPTRTRGYHYDDKQ